MNAATAKPWLGRKCRVRGYGKKYPDLFPPFFPFQSPTSAFHWLSSTGSRRKRCLDNAVHRGLSSEGQHGAKRARGWGREVAMRTQSDCFQNASPLSIQSHSRHLCYSIIILPVDYWDNLLTHLPISNPPILTPVTQTESYHFPFRELWCFSFSTPYWRWPDERQFRG